MRVSLTALVIALVFSSAFAQAETCSSEQVSASFSKATDYFWTNCFLTPRDISKNSAMLTAECEYGGTHVFTMKLDRQCNVIPSSVVHAD